MTGLTIGLIAAALTGVQVGSAMVATRALDGALGPVTLALLRYGVALAVLSVPFLRAGYGALPRRDLMAVAALGVVQFGLLIILLNWGLTRVGAAEGAVLFGVFPLVALALAAVLGRERAPPRLWLGMTATLAGIALVTGAGQGGVVDPSGAAAVLAAAVCGAAAAVGFGPWLARYPTLRVGTVSMAAAVVALVPPALAEAPWTALAALPPRGWLLVAFIGLTSGAGYLVWLTALRHLPAGRAALLLGLSPVTAAALGTTLLGEAVSPGFWPGLALVLAGVSLALARPGPKLAIGPERR